MGILSYIKTKPMLNIIINSPQLFEKDTPKRIRPKVQAKKQPPIPLELLDLRVKVAVDLVIKDTLFQITDVIAQNRTYNIVKLRHIAMYLCATHTDLTLVEIGRNFSKDHSTVMHARQSVTDQGRFNKKYGVRLNYYEKEFMRLIIENNLTDNKDLTEYLMNN